MRRIRKQVTIDAPIATVYEVVANVRRYPDFVPGVESVDLEGEVIKMGGRLGPLSLTMKNRARFVPNKSIAFELVDGPFRSMDGRWTFEQIPNGTRVTYTTDYEFGLALRLPGVRLAVETALRTQVEQIVAAFRGQILKVHRQALASESQL